MYLSKMDIISVHLFCNHNFTLLHSIMNVRAIKTWHFKLNIGMCLLEQFSSICFQNSKYSKDPWLKKMKININMNDKWLWWAVVIPCYQKIIVLLLSTCIYLWLFGTQKLMLSGKFIFAYLVYECPFAMAHQLSVLFTLLSELGFKSCSTSLNE